MRGFRRRRTAAALIGLCLASPLAGETLQCDDPLFQTSGDDLATLEQTCRAASEARQSLASCGVSLTRPVEIEVTEVVDSEFGPCIGLFHCGEDKIELLSPSAMSEVRDRTGAFAEVSDTAFWESVIAHELTHAAYDTIICPYSSCITTSEYAGYAMQVWSLPKDERERFGLGLDVQTIPRREAFSPATLFFSPDRFALLAWRHFEAQRDPCALMRRIMAGTEHFDSEPF